MKGLKRTHRCTEISTANIGENVTLMGWVQKSRNKGGIIFVDLRDRSGIMQVIFENGSIDQEGFEKAGKLKAVTIKSTSLKKVGKNAFKGIHAKAKIKVPAKKLRSYKRLLKGKGQKAGVKITK